MSPSYVLHIEQPLFFKVLYTCKTIPIRDVKPYHYRINSTVTDIPQAHLTHSFRTFILVDMSTILPALYDVQFPLDMLKDIALLSEPEAIAASYGYDFEHIKDLPNFKAQLSKVESELFNEGILTRVMAEMGLNKAVETMNMRLASGAIDNDDLNKFANTLYKITERDKASKGGSDKPQFTIEIQLGNESVTLNARTVEREVQAADDIDLDEIDEELERLNGTAKDPAVRSKVGEVPMLDVDDDEDPFESELVDSIYNSSNFSLEIDNG